MTTRECYFKAYVETDLPCILMVYATSDDRGVHVGKSVAIRFKDGNEKNITKLEEISSKPDFYKWCNDPEFQKQWRGITWKPRKPIENF